MIILPKLCLLACLGADSHEVAVASLATPTAAIAAVPQGRGGPFKPGSAAPSGGTPEPASMLLLVGGAIGYGAWRLKRQKASKES